VPTTSDQFALAQSWIGTTETQATFDARYDRYLAEGSDADTALAQAIEESMRQQLSQMVFDQPGQVSLPGGLSANYQANIQALMKNLQYFRDTQGSAKGRVVPVYRTSDR
jgi:hypothetical protein